MTLHASFLMPIMVVMSGIAMGLCLDMNHRTTHRAEHGSSHCAPEGEQYG